jgi:hypothetical protein
MKKALLLLTFLIVNSLCLPAQDKSGFRYQTGDLLFQDLDCGKLCDAIERVTPGVHNKHFSHIGLVYVIQDSVWVIEAIGKDVHLTPLNAFTGRQLNEQGNPKILVGRLAKPYRGLIPRAVGFALKQNGKPYDDEFIYDNGKYYCSELIYDAFKEANNNTAFFHLYPMTFKDPANDKTDPAWKNYYKDLGKKIPEGRLGCNPGSIAISESVEIIKEFY